MLQYFIESHILLSIASYHTQSCKYQFVFIAITDSLSIIVISLFFISHMVYAGYGNKTPTTDLGKVTTIFYAIIGMPLFLLYLSNIGNLSPLHTYIALHIHINKYIQY